MKAYLGVYTARLEMPWVDSLKQKRAIVKPAIERLKSRFPVSAARIAGLDDHGWEVVGVSVISNDGAWVEQVLDEVATFLRQFEFEVSEEQFQVETYELDGVLPLWAK
jgi:hypothetical protein